LAYAFISLPDRNMAFFNKSLKNLQHLDMKIIEKTSKNNKQYILKMSSF
jgi:hypothetical protein